MLPFAARVVVVYGQWVLSLESAVQVVSPIAGQISVSRSYPGL